MFHSRWITYRTILFALLLILLAISAIGVRYPSDFIWEHVLTVVGLAFLVRLDVKGKPLSNASYTLLFVYFSLHVLGAHFTYSEVPYDDWSRQFFGTSISEMFGQTRQRNHFDRFVHFVFGILLLHPTRELVQRGMNVRSVHAIVIAGAFLITFGTLYEIFEWLYAVFAGAEAAEHYNGQQGDMFDAQKDIVLNISGTVLGGFLSAVLGSNRNSPQRTLRTQRGQ
jgi:putative membrane protein